ncbi:unnamed protein product [Prunus brigantina]
MEVNPRHQEHAKAVHILRSGKKKLSKSKKGQGLDEIIETFKKVQINILLLNAIARIPKCAKFLKDLCTNKRRFKEHEQVALSKEVSAVLQRKLPPKLKDPGSFSIPCIVSDFKFQKAVLDLGVSINLMPHHAYEKVNLGRPFMATAGAIIDVKNGTLTMNVFDETIAFKVFEASKFPNDEHEVFHLDAIDTMVKEALPMSYLEPIEACITQSIRKEEVDSLEAVIAPLLLELICNMDSHIEVGKRYANQFESLPADTGVLEAIEAGWKQGFLSGRGSKERRNDVSEARRPSFQLTGAKRRLVRTKAIMIHATCLRIKCANRRAHLKGRDTSCLSHRFEGMQGTHPLESIRPGPRPRPKNPGTGGQCLCLINYSLSNTIFDNKWVSPVQVVPKKSGITVVKNEANELVLTWMTTGWRVCIDYRKLNTATSKDHFPLPFIDQMLERLAGHSDYCFLDGYSGCSQIAIALEDQEKTTFTCPFGTFAYSWMPFGFCNPLATFQRCMMSIFSDIVERFIDVFMDDFSVSGDSFDQCLHNLSKVLARCEQSNLLLNWEKCHFMVSQGIVIGHVIYSKELRRFIKDFSKIARPLCNLLAKEWILCLIKTIMSLELFWGSELISSHMPSTMLVEPSTMPNPTIPPQRRSSKKDVKPRLI